MDEFFQDVANMLENMHIAELDETEDIDIEILSAFVERFSIFVEDSCPEAISAYLRKVPGLSVSDVTKLHIMQSAQRAYTACYTTETIELSEAASVDGLL